MALTRFGYLVILTILATAAAAIAFVVWPDGSSGDSDGNSGLTPIAAAPTATPLAADLPDVEFARVIQFVRLGAVVSLEAEGQRVIVNFNPSFDTSGLGADANQFESFLPAGTDIEQALRAADVPFNEPGGVDVIIR